MNGPDVVYDIVAQLRPFVLSRKLFEALAIRLYLHKSISSFHGASIDFPSLPPLAFLLRPLQSPSQQGTANHAFTFTRNFDIDRAKFDELDQR